MEERKNMESMRSTFTVRVRLGDIEAEVEVDHDIKPLSYCADTGDNHCLETFNADALIDCCIWVGDEQKDYEPTVYEWKQLKMIAEEIARGL